MDQELSPGVRRYVEKAREEIATRQAYRREVRKLRFDTVAVHGMYSAEEAFAGGQGGIIEPIFPSTSQAYRDSDEMEAGLDYLIPTWCYSRIHNPTGHYLEETLPHIGGRIMGGFAGFVVGGLLGSAAWLAIGAPQEAYGLAMLVGLSFSVGGAFFVSRSIRANTEISTFIIDSKFNIRIFNNRKNEIA